MNHKICQTWFERLGLQNSSMAARNCFVNCEGGPQIAIGRPCAWSALSQVRIWGEGFVEGWLGTANIAPSRSDCGFKLSSSFFISEHDVRAAVLPIQSSHIGDCNFPTQTMRSGICAILSLQVCLRVALGELLRSGSPSLCLARQEFLVRKKVVETCFGRLLPPGPVPASQRFPSKDAQATVI